MSRTLLSNVIYNENTHRLHLEKGSVEDILMKLDRPVSVILQITRKCHFNCVFCSEKYDIPDPTLEELSVFENHLRDVPRIFLSGGEPLTRNDFKEVVEIFSQNHILGLPTNAVASKDNIAVIKDNNISVNVGLDGPRSVTSKVRGDYDFIMKGIHELIINEIPFSLTAVVLRSTMDSVLYTCQMADTLGAKKLKFVLPIPKGNAINMDRSEYITEEEAVVLCNEIKKYKKKYGWRTLYTFTIWNDDTDGYSILIYPNGKTYAWPVRNETEKVMLLGDIHTDTIEAIWDRYPYKYNHVNKYLGNAIKLM